MTGVPTHSGRTSLQHDYTVRQGGMLHRYTACTSVGERSHCVDTCENVLEERW